MRPAGVLVDVGQEAERRQQEKPDGERDDEAAYELRSESAGGALRESQVAGAER